MGMVDYRQVQWVEEFEPQIHADSEKISDPRDGG